MPATQERPPAPIDTPSSPTERMGASYSRTTFILIAPGVVFGHHISGSMSVSGETFATAGATRANKVDATAPHARQYMAESALNDALFVPRSQESSYSNAAMGDVWNNPYAVPQTEYAKDYTLAPETAALYKSLASALADAIGHESHPVAARPIKLGSSRQGGRNSSMKVTYDHNSEAAQERRRLAAEKARGEVLAKDIATHKGFGWVEAYPTELGRLEAEIAGKNREVMKETGRPLTRRETIKPYLYSASLENADPKSKLDAQLVTALVDNRESQ